MRRCITQLLMITFMLVAVASLQVSVNAVDPAEAFEYTISDGEVTITRYIGAEGDVIIPDTIEGLPVTCVASFAFTWKNHLTSLTLGKNVTSFESYAIEQCANLTAIWVDKDNPSYCNDSQGVLYSKDKTKLILVPTNVQGSYTIPNSVTSIDAGAFQGCSFTSITIPQSVTSIGAWAFEFCDNLVSITIPNGVTSIEAGTFSYCSSLTAITIPDSVSSIGASAFDSCDSLENITIPESVTSIGEYAFVGCSGLKSIIIPNKVTSIQSGAFYDCINLTSITLPESVTNIGEFAFKGCTALKDIFYQGSATQWANITAGFDNEFLANTTIHYNATNAILGDFDSDGAVTNKDVVYLLWYTLFPEDYPIKGDADFTGDDKVNNEDVVYMLWHTLFPEDYPLTA